MIIRPEWDAPHVRCFPRGFCAWPCLLRQVGTALGSPCDCIVTGITYPIPGPDRLGIKAGLSVGFSNPWSKSSLAFYSYIVTLGIREQRKASFSPYPLRSEFWYPLSFLRDNRTRLIYV